MLPTVIFKNPRSELILLQNNQSEFRQDEIKIRPIHMKLVKFIIFGGTSGSAENFTVPLSFWLHAVSGRLIASHSARVQK